MKTWKAAELVELNITETENGNKNSYMEFDVNGVGLNDTLINDNTGGNSSTPETLS